MDSIELEIKSQHIESNIIEITKSLPHFSVMYLDVWLDMIISNPLKGAVNKHPLLKYPVIENDVYKDLSSEIPNCIFLLIMQKGGSLAKNVKIYCHQLYHQTGFIYFSVDDFVVMYNSIIKDKYDPEDSNWTYDNKKCSVLNDKVFILGDIDIDEGKLLPITFLDQIFEDDSIRSKYADPELDLRTSKKIYIPYKITYKSIFSDSVYSYHLREMLTNPIIITAYIKGRG